MATPWWICKPKLSSKCCLMKLIQKDADTNEGNLVAALVERVAHKLPEVENKTLGRTLGDSEGRTTY